MKNLPDNFSAMCIEALCQRLQISLEIPDEVSKWHPIRSLSAAEMQALYLAAQRAAGREWKEIGENGPDGSLVHMEERKSATWRHSVYKTLETTCGVLFDHKVAEMVTLASVEPKRVEFNPPVETTQPIRWNDYPPDK